MSDDKDWNRDKDEFGRFTENNDWWRVALERGSRPVVFTGPEDVFEAASQYFEWIGENPLIEIDFKGKDADQVHIPKMRAPTIKGLCASIGITDRWWRILKKDRENLTEAMELVEQIIFQMKFEGAAAGFLNPAIIARELGLADHGVLGGMDGGPIQIEAKMTDFDIARRLAFTLAEAAEKMKNKTPVEDKSE